MKHLVHHLKSPGPDWLAHSRAWNNSQPSTNGRANDALGRPIEETAWPFDMILMTFNFPRKTYHHQGGLPHNVKIVTLSTCTIYSVRQSLLTVNKTWTLKRVSTIRVQAHVHRQTPMVCLCLTFNTGRANVAVVHCSRRATVFMVPVGFYRSCVVYTLADLEILISGSAFCLGVQNSPSPLCCLLAHLVQLTILN